MKQIIKLIMAMLIVAFTVDNCFAQIPGKTYQPGDTIIMDGMPCLVYKVDETGMHGTAMSPCARSTKELDKIKKRSIKYFEKEIKKGKATQDDMSLFITGVDRSKQIPFIAEEKGKGGKIYRVDDWSSKIPQGWRIPSTKDAEDFATFYCGGLGKDNGMGLKFLNKAFELTTDIFVRNNLLLVASNGMIVSDSNNPSDVKFLQKWNKSFKYWFELKDEFLGTEKTVAVKDF